MIDVYEMPAIRILKICANNKHNMREFLKNLRQNHNKTYESIKDLKNAGLISYADKKNARGRPTKSIHITRLGQEFLDDYTKLRSKRIHLTDENIKKAVYQANFAELLVKSSIDPYDRFIEMNKIAFSISGP